MFKRGSRINKIYCLGVFMDLYEQLSTAVRTYDRLLEERLAVNSRTHAAYTGPGGNEYYAGGAGYAAANPSPYVHPATTANVPTGSPQYQGGYHGAPHGSSASYQGTLQGYPSAGYHGTQQGPNTGYHGYSEPGKASTPQPPSYRPTTATAYAPTSGSTATVAGPQPYYGTTTNSPAYAATTSAPNAGYAPTQANYEPAAYGTQQNYSDQPPNPYQGGNPAGYGPNVMQPTAQQHNPPVAVPDTSKPLIEF